MTTFEGPRVADIDGVGALTMGGFLGEVAARFGPNEAVVLDDPLRDGETVRWTYERLATEARRIGRALLAAGVEPGDAVGVLMGNRPEAVAAIFGVALAGGVAAPMSTFSPRPELAQLVDTCRATVVLTQSRLLARRFGEDVAAIAEDRPHLTRVAVLGEPSWDELLAAGDAVPDDRLDERAAAITPDDPALVIFSSGTTSAPKGILHAHRSPSLQCWVQAGVFARHPGTRMFSALPLFWTAGFNTAVGATLAAGGCWVAQETFDPGAALALMARERVTEPYTLPHQTAALAEHPDWATTDLSALRCVYGKGAYARHPRVDGDPGVDHAGRVGHVRDVRVRVRPPVRHAARAGQGRARRPAARRAAARRRPRQRRSCWASTRRASCACPAPPACSATSAARPTSASTRTGSSTPATPAT